MSDDRKCGECGGTGVFVLFSIRGGGSRRPCVFCGGSGLWSETREGLAARLAEVTALLREAVPAVESEMQLYDALDRHRVMEFGSPAEASVGAAANTWFDLLERIRAAGLAPRRE